MNYSIYFEVKDDLVRLTTRCLLSSIGWLFCSFFLSCFFLYQTSVAEESEKIQYVSQQNNSVTGILVPDPSPGTVPVSDNTLIDFQIDGKSLHFSLSASGDGSASLSTMISSIEEGRHAAYLESDNPDGSLKDSKQVLFIYDITPPNLERVFPESAEISKNMLSFVVEFSDEGSGIASQRDDIDVTATINGVEASIETVENDNKRYFLIDYEGQTGIKGDTGYQLFISLKDRAGNEATLEESFKTEEIYEEISTEEKTCTSPNNEKFNFDATTQHDFSFPLTNRLSPVLFSRDNRADIVEIAINTGEELDSSILDLITISADHPELVLRRLPASGNYPVRYELEQRSVVRSLDGLSYLTVEYPRLLSAEYEWECSADGTQMESSLANISASVDRTSFQVPVILYWKNSRSFETNSVQGPDGSYLIEYLTWTEPSSQLLDTAASYLSFQNSAYLFDQQDGTFTSRAPVEQEGFYTFQVTLASAAGTWAHNGRAIGQEDHEILFDLGGPVIDEFWYNTEDGQLEALFSDLGTAAEDLQISVIIDGFGKRDFEIELLENGKTRLVSAFPMPPSVADAHVSITDLAQNNTKKSCKIFGVPPEKRDDGTASVSEYSLKEKDTKFQDDDTSKGYQILSSLSGGLSLVRKCPVEKVVAVSDYYIKDREKLTSRKNTGYYPYRSYRASGARNGNLLFSKSTDFQSPVVEIINPITGKPFAVAGSSIATKDRTHEIYSFEYCQNVIKDTLAPEIKGITFNPGDNSLSATISDHGRPASQVNTSLTVGIAMPRGFNSPVALNHEYTPERQPVIAVSPSLNAPGMPNYSIKKKILESLEVYPVDQWFRRKESSRSADNKGGATSAQRADFLAAIDTFIAYKESQTDATARPFEKGYGLSGTLSATLPVPPLVIGENYDITISAADAAGNISYETLLFTIPRSPPVVSLELINTDSVSSFTTSGGGQSSTHLRASAVDESGLDLYQTYLDLDSVRIHPLSTFGTGGLGNPPRNPNALSFSEILKDSYRSSWLDEYVAHYSVLLEEGPHTAHFYATDIMGLSADQRLDFTVEYMPKITNFVSKPKVVQDIGGPAFTAMITDYGGDLELSGITFLIDGTAVDQSTLYYDPPSGYFAANGPFNHESGFHSAQIIAVDGNGHKVTETIRFVVGEEITAVDGFGDLRLDSINIWELEHTNNDGQANPGELLRIFPTLFNSSATGLEKCTAKMFADDSRIVVETNQINAAFIDAAITTTLMRGFDVQIGNDILDATISDPYDTHFRLSVSCSDGNWEMPFILPVYRPTLPVDIDSQVSIELEPTPRNSSAAETTIRGVVVSSSSYVDSLSMTVNGQFIKDLRLDTTTGEFEAHVPLDPGSNIIEIEAYDRSGAVGFKTAFINCTSTMGVTIDRLPRSSAAAEIEISGTVESSASVVNRVVLTVNGREQSISWYANQNRFEARIILDPGTNRIVVDAWDEAGSYGRASVSVSLGSQFSIALDPLPAVTPDATININGTVNSSSAIDRVELLVNGTAQTADYNPSNRRFSASVSLAAGGNTISAEAVNVNGERASDRAYVTRTVLFDPPSINILSPGAGATAMCDPVVINGTFDAGSSTVEGISVSMTPSFLECSPVVIGAGTFSVECDVDLSPGESIYNVELRTGDGSTATDTVLVRTEGCS